MPETEIEMASLFVDASNWEFIPDVSRGALRNLVRSLVGYSCKLACVPNEVGGVDIHIFHDKKKRVVDCIEIQPTGAIGVVFEEYDDPDSDAVNRLDAACDNYNLSIGVEFEESDSESDEDEDEESNLDEINLS